LVAVEEAFKTLKGDLSIRPIYELMLTRYNQPEPELKLLLEKLRIALPPQSPPKITAAQAASATPV
jgi:hypothetical protein